MAVNTIDFKKSRSTDATRYPSPAIWADCPVIELLESPGKGLYFFDDFQNMPLAPTLTTQIGYGRYKAFANTGCTISAISTVNSVELEGGALQLAIDTDNDSVVLGQAFQGYLLSGLSSNSGKLWFECCYAQNSIATNMASTFIGLAEVDLFTFANAVPLNAGDAITNGGSIIGFRIEEDGLGVVDTVVSDRATSFTNIGDAEGGTLAANTFKKLGFVYDPYEDASRRIVFYADNLELTTKISHTTLTGYTNLDANALGLIWASCADSAGTSFKSWMKWWRVAQMMPS